MYCLGILFAYTGCEKYYQDDSSDNGSGTDVSATEDASDYTWDTSDIILIELNGSSVTENSDFVTTDGSKVTIGSAGTYHVHGTLTDGQIIVDTDDANIVRLVFNGVNITCSTGSPVYIKNATKAMIVMADNTENQLTDGTTYAVNSENEPDAAIFSKSYLSFFGNGSLIVKGNYEDGIAGKDGLVIKSGSLNITSADDGIRGRDYIIVRSGNITINAGGDGLTTTNEEDATMGYITIDNATAVINTPKGDGIDAVTDINISDGTFTFTSGGGSGTVTITSGTGGFGGPGGGNSSGGYSGTISEKALKTAGSITIEKGTFTIDAADDAIHSHKNVVINGGTITVATGDDALHAEASATFNDGTFIVTKSYEGVESPSITVKSGNISLSTSDDSFNATKGVATESNDGSCLNINGGNIVVNTTSGDGIDSNGNVVMTGGTVIAHGPQSQPEVCIDVNGTFTISGGLLIGTGPNSGNMIEATSTTSEQNCVKVTIASTLSTSTLFHIQDASGVDLVTYKPVRSVYYVVFSSPVLTTGSTYNIYTGGTSTGTFSNGLYTGGTYSGGTFKKSFAISAKVTNVSF